MVRNNLNTPLPDQVFIKIREVKQNETRNGDIKNALLRIPIRSVSML